jgi:hypothetical protein
MRNCTRISPRHARRWRKVEKECKDVLALGASILKGGHERASAMEPMQAQRAILRNKTIALSDLLAVFRAL